MLTRALKEVRSLLPPAGLTVGAAVLAMAGGHTHAVSALSVRLALLGFYIGTALLAATSFGSEFQQRTLVLLLSQPVARTRLWLEKWAVLVAVAGAVAAIQFALVRLGPFAVPQQETGRELLYLIAILCSAAFWTLVARSTIGGFAFSMAALFLFEMSAGFVAEHVWQRTEPVELFALSPSMIALRLAYSAVTLWLGWRLFQRFQVTDVAYGERSFSFGGSSWSVLRARPSGAVRNLLLKELWLHRPTCLIAGVFTLCWLTALALLSVVPWRYGTPEFVFTLLLGIYVPLVTVLAGAVSHGEEAGLGIRPWHLTLPVSARAQWGIKLAISLLLCLALSIALPAGLSLLARRGLSLGQEPFPLAFKAIGWLVILSVAVLSFWAATLVGHTIRAAVAAGLMALGIFAGGALATWLGDLVSRGLAHVVTFVIVRWQLPPDYFDVYPYLRRIEVKVLASVFTVGLLIALWQSFAAFKRAQTGSRTVRLYAVQLLSAISIVIVCWVAFIGAWTRQYESQPVEELRQAVRGVLEAEPDAQVRDERNIALSELEATGALSPSTKRWLSDTRIVATRGRGFKGRRVYLLSIFFPHERKYRAGFLVTVTERPPHR